MVFDYSDQELRAEQLDGLTRLGYTCTLRHAQQRMYRVHFDATSPVPASNFNEASRIELERACFDCDQATDRALNWRLEILTEPGLEIDAGF
jgi:hypothetical protein